MTTTVEQIDPMVVAKKHYKLLFENDRVRVMEVLIPVGDKTATHSHPAHIVYALAEGKARLNLSDGTSRELILTPGLVAFLEPQTHWTQNIGDVDVRVLVTELKT